MERAKLLDENKQSAHEGPKIKFVAGTDKNDNIIEVY